jgi:hypothetical protein
MAWKGSKLGLLPSHVLVVLTLVGHVIGTLGFPMLSPRTKGRAEIAFPCQNRPCGCLTSEQCWAGDCCCFTLSEKLAWAEANGIEPPAHVRPLVESRKERPASRPKPTCCEGGGAPGVSEPTCCCGAPESKKGTEGEGRSCCDQTALQREVGITKAANCSKPHVTWVVGILAQKCRGEGPAGLFLWEPTLVAADLPFVLPRPQPSTFLPTETESALYASPQPPTPPPRRI